MILELAVLSLHELRPRNISFPFFQHFLAQEMQKPDVNAKSRRQQGKTDIYIIDRWEIKDVGNAKKPNYIFGVRIPEIQRILDGRDWKLFKGEAWQLPGKWKLRSGNELDEGIQRLVGIWKLNEQTE